MKRTLFSRMARPLVALLLVAFCTLPIALADTDGTELQITDRPDRLILQLGPQWSGVEFQLKTDAGVFPVPVVVDASGVLEMDLGGSKEYILSCLGTPTPIPVLSEPSSLDSPPAFQLDSEPRDAPEDDEPFPIPPLPLILFGGGLLLAAGGLVLMHIRKGRSKHTGTQNESDDEDMWY